MPTIGRLFMAPMSLCQRRRMIELLLSLFAVFEAWARKIFDFFGDFLNGELDDATLMMSWNCPQYAGKYQESLQIPIKSPAI